MARKTSALFILTAFILMSASCVTWSRKEVKTLTSPLPEGTTVLSVVLNDGQIIEFTKANPGRVRGYTIVGTGKDAATREIEIVGPFTSIRQDDKGHIAELVDGKRQGWVVKTVIKSDGGRMTILGTEAGQLTVPLKEIAAVLIGAIVAVPLMALLI